MNISDDTRCLLRVYKRTYPWAKYVSRSQGSCGALRLHKRQPEATEKGFVPTGRWVELLPEFLPEVPEGVMMRLETLLNGGAGKEATTMPEIKPCPYCAEPFEEIVGDVAEIVQISPLPPLNLTTGEVGEASQPYYAIRVLWVEDGDDVAEEFIPIRYCPMCGRKLETPEHASNGAESSGG